MSFRWWLLLVVFATSSPAGWAAAPNIIFILSDDHRYDYLSSAGHPFVKTPALDRLADEGVRFDNAFVTSSLCSPSRASFLTGQYPVKHGVRNNATPWQSDNLTFLEALHEQGYETAFIGKWHMPGNELPSLPGVDHFVSFTAALGQGQYYNCPLIVDGVEEPSAVPYITEELTNRALAFIRQPRDKPFALYLSHKAVHNPFTPSEAYRGKYDDTPVRLPQEAGPWTTFSDGNYFYLNLAPLDLLMRRYAETVEAMDAQIARVLDELDERGLAENTVVVYAGDNGFLWGEHGVVDKRWAYEESIRIPFILRYPAGVREPGRSATQMVLNIDLAPTLLELAGAPVPESMDGLSLLGVLNQTNSTLREDWLYQYDKELFYNVPDILALRTSSHVYIQYAARKPAEIFDLQRDPLQQHNLMETSQGQQLLPELQARLEALVAEQTQ